MLEDMKNKILAVLILFGLVSCDVSEKTITKTHDVTDQYIDIKVTTFKTQSELNKFLKEKEYNNGPDVEGLARWAHPKDDLTVVSRCDIYVVEPSGVRDTSDLSTWGHELAHCIYGSYHKEGER